MDAGGRCEWTIVATCPNFPLIGSERSARLRRCNTRTHSGEQRGSRIRIHVHENIGVPSSSSSSVAPPERLGLGRLSLSYWRLVVSWLVALFYYDYNSMPAAPCTRCRTERPKRDYRLGRPSTWSKVEAMEKKRKKNPPFDYVDSRDKSATKTSSLNSIPSIFPFVTALFRIRKWMKRKFLSDHFSNLNLEKKKERKNYVRNKLSRGKRSLIDRFPG